MFFNHVARIGYYVVVSLEKTFKANFLTGTLCGVERRHRGLFHNGIYRRKKSNKKTSGHGIAGISESGWVTIALSLMSDVVPRVRRIYRSNKRINVLLSKKIYLLHSSQFQ